MNLKGIRKNISSPESALKVYDQKVKKKKKKMKGCTMIHSRDGLEGKIFPLVSPEISRDSAKKKRSEPQ